MAASRELHCGSADPEASHKRRSKARYVSSSFRGNGRSSSGRCSSSLPSLLASSSCLLLLLLPQTYKVTARMTHMPWEPPDNDPFNLTEIIDYLRAGDNRLVRPVPSDVTYFRQKEMGPYVERMDEILAVMNNDDGRRSIRERAQAAHALALCTTNQHRHRRRIGKDPRVHKSALDMVGLIREGGATYRHEAVAAAAAAAAELIWILTFASSANHGRFVLADAVPVLGRALVACSDADGHVPAEGCTPQVQMWICAAIQNLAASYCQTPSGRCEWRWVDDEDGERDGAEKLVLAEYVSPYDPYEDEEEDDDEEGEWYEEEFDLDTPEGRIESYEAYREQKERFSPPKDITEEEEDEYDHDYTPWFDFTGDLWIDSSAVRDEFLAIEGLVPELIRLTCHMSPRNEVGVHPMPGDGRYQAGWGKLGTPDLGAEIHRDELNPAIVPWAAAGALKNLALSDAGREAIMPSASVCLCGLRASPDVLESDKGMGALMHLGRVGDCYYDRVESSRMLKENPWQEDHKDVPLKLLVSYCLDERWVSTDGHTCTNVDIDAEPSDCDTYGSVWKDKDGMTVKEACCVCGGGESVKVSKEINEL